MADRVLHLAQPRTFDFLGVAKYQNVNRWADMIMERPATYRGMRVCAGGARLRLRPRVACSLTVCLAAPKPWQDDKGLPASPLDTATSKIKGHPKFDDVKSKILGGMSVTLAPLNCARRLAALNSRVCC